jgi:hypothetical protein
MGRNQSAADRADRLSHGRCPIHGIGMPQVSPWEKKIGGMLDGADVAVVECPRKDCGIQAYSCGPVGPCELLPKWHHLLRGE